MNAPFLIAEYKRIRESLLTQFPELAEDETALIDTIDGETGALDAVAYLVRSAREDEATAKALSDMLGDMRERKARFERRADTRRAGALAMMEALGVRKVERPDFSASIRQTPPKVEIVDERLLPDHFIRLTPSPEKSAIAEALKAGKVVQGAVLSNGGNSISVRFK